jgi:hypothetical protein
MKDTIEVKRTLKELRLEKKFRLIAAEYLFPDSFYDFIIAHTPIARKYVNPSDAKKILAKFNHDGKHWIIYLK